MCAQNSTYSLFIPGFVLCTNPFLFRIKIANELSEFRNYLHNLFTVIAILTVVNCVRLCHLSLKTERITSPSLLVR